ncbi:hypothetical protein ABZ079_29490 [Streptomyces sp. NPDC006314]|uniref:hypothetical protein n=1 Tax=Streptomyces sp. NPDC006314 TaxID=3154475 RepID=UPI0033A6A463
MLLLLCGGQLAFPVVELLLGFRGLLPGPLKALLLVMARRSLSDPGELAYYLACAPAGIELASWSGSPAPAGRSRACIESAW